jgi:DNA-binding GntR family transcriptional regulator
MDSHLPKQEKRTLRFEGWHSVTDSVEKMDDSARGGKTGVPLVERAYQQIKRMLLLRELVPEQKLRYQDIAKKINVSQTPVILALTRLENEGLVKSEANKGFYIPELDLAEARELYEMRAVIESFLVERVAGQITDEQLEELAGLMNAHQSFRSESYTRERLWCDARFHIALASFSSHQVGERILRQLFDRLYLRYIPERLSSVRMLESEREHDQVFSALKDRNAPEAASLLRRHIERGQQHILRGLQKEAKSRDVLMPWA